MFREHFQSQIDSVNPWHQNVCNEHINRPGTLFKHSQGCITSCLVHIMAIQDQHLIDAIAQAFFILHQQDRCQ